MSQRLLHRPAPQVAPLWCGDHHPLDVEYIAPRDLDEAVAAVLSGPEGTVLLAGGQSLVPALRQGLWFAQRLVDVTRMPQLRELSADSACLRIGAGVTLSAFLAAPPSRLAPLLVQAGQHVGNFTIRNQATFGGMLAWADPMAEVPLALRMMDAEVQTTLRTLPAAALVRGTQQQALRRGEIIRRIDVPLDAARRFAFREVARRPSGGKALLAAVAGVDIRGTSRLCRIGLGGGEMTAWATWPSGEDAGAVAARLLGDASQLTGWQAVAGAHVVAGLLDDCLREPTSP